jgi:hypothetical protein
MFLCGRYHESAALFEKLLEGKELLPETYLVGQVSKAVDYLAKCKELLIVTIRETCRFILCKFGLSHCHFLEALFLSRTFLLPGNHLRPSHRNLLTVGHITGSKAQIYVVLDEEFWIKESATVSSAVLVSLTVQRPSLWCHKRTIGKMPLIINQSTNIPHLSNELLPQSFRIWFLK